MESNGIKTPKIIESEKKCIFVDYTLKDFYVQLAGGRTTANLTPSQYLECKVILKLNEKQLVDKEFYAVFGCWDEYNYSDPTENFKCIYKRYTYLLPNRHIFKFTYDSLKDEYIMIFGNSKDDYKLQFFEPGIYLCWFDLVEKSKDLLDHDNPVFVWPRIFNEKNALGIYGYRESDHFIVSNRKNN